ncbi:MAG: PD40 domain-containing protein [Candidatus Hydrogenedentes bacterium]|nr:PD40 domain-containing protein [Candidatus Hydrogenedentota bacterium]
MPILRLLLCLCAVALVAFAQEDRTQITTGTYRDVDPMISPDGNSLAFASNRTGHFNIFVFSYKTSGTLQLTQSDKDDRYPNWSADGRKVVFGSNRTGKGDIYETSNDGSSGFLQLTDAPLLEEYPNYPSDRRGLLYARDSTKSGFTQKMQVILSDSLPASSNAVVLAEGDQPRFSPNGSRIVFVSHRTKNDDIWTMTREGSSQTQLTTDDKDDTDPYYSPNGSKIVFSSKRTGNYDIWVMDSDGGNQRQLTFDQADEIQPCWSVGGYIYYTHQVSETASNIYRIKAPK